MMRKMNPLLYGAGKMGRIRNITDIFIGQWEDITLHHHGDDQSENFKIDTKAGHCYQQKRG